MILHIYDASSDRARGWGYKIEKRSVQQANLSTSCKPDHFKLWSTFYCTDNPKACSEDQNFCDSRCQCLCYTVKARVREVAKQIMIMVKHGLMLCHVQCETT